VAAQPAQPAGTASLPGTLPAGLHLYADAADVQFLEAEGSGEGEKKKLRRFEMTGYTGVTMRVGWSWLPVSIDLTGMKIPAKAQPILKDHSTSLIVGHTTDITVSQQRLKLKGVISGVGEAAQEVLALADNGFPWQASVGIEVHKYVLVDKGETATVNGRVVSGPAYIVQKSVLREVSFLPIGADGDTSARIAASGSNETTVEITVMNPFDKWLTAKGFNPESLTEDQKTALKAAFDADQKPPSDPAPTPATPPTSGASGTPPANTGPSVVEKLRAEAGAELERIAAIRKACNGKHAEIEAKAVKEGWDVSKCELEVLRAERPSGPAIHAGASGHEKPADVIQAALCMSAGMRPDFLKSHYDEKTLAAAQARDMRHFGFCELFHHVIASAGKYARPGRLTEDTIRTAFEAEALLRASGFSTVGLADTLSNVANKALLQSFFEIPSTVEFFCATTDLTDFKPATRIRITAAGGLTKVGADGELKHLSLTDQKFQNQLDTYGGMLALPRQMLIDDDLGAFLQIPQLLGRGAAVTREELVFTLLLSNPNNFFHANNANLLTGGTSVLAIQGLTLGEQLFLDQKDANGKPVMIRPAVLLVPTSLKVTGEQLYADKFVNETTTTDKPKPNSNPHSGKFRPYASPWLNSVGLAGQSATAWYLFGEPGAAGGAIQLGYLRGQRTPTIESGDTNFNTLGMQWRIFWDLGVAMGEPKAAVKSNGA
jgi:hypothetical protein